MRGRAGPDAEEMSGQIIIPGVLAELRKQNACFEIPNFYFLVEAHDSYGVFLMDSVLTPFESIFSSMTI